MGASARHPNVVQLVPRQGLAPFIASFTSFRECATFYLHIGGHHIKVFTLDITRLD